MRIAIVGSRGYQPLHRVINRILALPKDSIIISGGAIGVDRTAQETALKLGMEIKTFLPDWDKHKKAAGMIRNTEIIKESGKVIAFWDGSSRGTFDSIKKAHKLEKPLEIWFINGDVIYDPTPYHLEQWKAKVR